MSYTVKSIYKTIQGEGANAGRACVILRFAFCNLWSGREEDRGKQGACSAWCDTDFVGTDGSGGGKFARAHELAFEVGRAWGPDYADRLVVCTGGEPALQLDYAMVASLRRFGFRVAVETNGTRALQPVDWVTVSPKAGADLAVTRGDELKLVYPQEGVDPASFESLAFRHFFLQPMDGPDRDRNAADAARYCMDHPRWRLGIQMHKFVGLP